MKTHSVCLLILLMLCIGCASPKYHSGIYMLQRGDIDGAIRFFTDAQKVAPTSVEIYHDLGLAYRRKIERAIRWKEVVPPLENGVVVMDFAYFGKLLFSLNLPVDQGLDLPFSQKLDNGTFPADLQQAFEDNGVSLPDNITVSVAEKRRLWLIKDENEVWMYTIQRADGKLNAYNRTNVDFQNLSKGITLTLATQLRQVGFTVLAGGGVQKALLGEIELSKRGIIDPETRQRVGQLSGAEWIVIGFISQSAPGQLRLDASPFQVTAPNREHPFVGVTDDENQFHELEKQLALELIQNAMGKPLTRAQQDTIYPVPTQNLNAFLLFSEGLELFERGEYAAATSKFDEALREEREKDFTQAREMRDLSAQIFVTPAAPPQRLLEDTAAEIIPGGVPGGTPSSGQRDSADKEKVRIRVEVR